MQTHLLLLFALLAWRFTNTHTKVVYTLEQKKLVRNVSNFCYSIAPLQHADLRVQTIVHHENHKLAILYHTPAKTPTFFNSLSAEELLSISNIAYDINSSTANPLTPSRVTPNHPQQRLFSFDYSTTFDDRMNNYCLSVYLVSVGAPIHALSKVEFRNPGGLWEKHFSKNEQGLLPLYLYLVLLSLLVLLRWYSANTYFVNFKSNNAFAVISTLACVACGCFCIANILQCSNIIIYALNGTGLYLFKFLAQVAEMALRVLCTAINLSFLHSCFKKGAQRGNESVNSTAFRLLMLHVWASVLFLFAQSQDSFSPSAYTAIYTWYVLPLLVTHAATALYFHCVAAHYAGQNTLLTRSCGRILHCDSVGGFSGHGLFKLLTALKGKLMGSKNPREFDCSQHDFQHMDDVYYDSTCDNSSTYAESCETMGKPFPKYTIRNFDTNPQHSSYSTFDIGEMGRRAGEDLQNNLQHDLQQNLQNTHSDGISLEKKKGQHVIAIAKIGGRISSSINRFADGASESNEKYFWRYSTVIPILYCMLPAAALGCACCTYQPAMWDASIISVVNLLTIYIIQRQLSDDCVDINLSPVSLIRDNIVIHAAYQHVDTAFHQNHYEAVIK